MNNAAETSVRKLLIDLEVEDVEKTWGPTLWSVIHCSQLAARQMIAQGDGGSIISISSVQGVRPYALSTAYNGAKAAVIHMSRTWAVELAQHVHPRQHHRARMDRLRRASATTPTKTRSKRWGAQLPFKRLGKPEEIKPAWSSFSRRTKTPATSREAHSRMDGGFILPRMTKLEY